MQKDVQENLAAVEKALVPFIAQIQAFTIVDEETKMNAAGFLAEIKKRHKALNLRREEKLAPIKKKMEPLKEEAKEIDNSYKIWMEKLEKVARILNDGLVRYVDEQDRKARIEAERIRKEQEAKERAEAERIAALKAEEERLRKEAEAAESAEEKARLEFEADDKQDEAVKAELQAEEALAVTEMPVVQEPEKTVRTHAGVFSVKKVWTWEVEDMPLLWKSHPELFILDEKKVNKLMREGVRDLAGIKFYQVSQGATRT